MLILGAVAITAMMLSCLPASALDTCTEQKIEYIVATESSGGTLIVMTTTMLVMTIKQVVGSLAE